MSEATRAASRQFLDGAQRLAAASPGRRVPSPSSVARCRREVWFKGKEWPQDNFPDNGESYISAESGRATEGVLADIVEAAGFGQVVSKGWTEDERELLPRQLERISCSGGQHDGLLDTGDGWALLEFKRKGVYDMKELILGRRDAHDGGVLAAQPNEYTQMQLLMGALELPRALYVAANWDRGVWTRNVPRPRPDAVHVEWVEFNQRSFDLSVKRAQEHQELKSKEHASEVPRDFDPGEGNFPCSWCPFLKACRKAG